MHFSIPDTEECFADGKSRGQFTTFHVHVNGVFHCSARYSRLLAFHEELRKEFDPKLLGAAVFPPKRYLALTPAQLEERRKALEMYLQKLSQIPPVVRGKTFKTFMVEGEKQRSMVCVEVEVEIFLVNGKSKVISCLSTDRTEDLLEDMCKEINMDEDLTYYFGLYLVLMEDTPLVVRKMMDFEQPYLSLQREGESHQIQLRKAYWDPTFDKLLMEDKIACNLLYVQAIADIKNKHLEVPKDMESTLKSLKQKGSKKEFLQALKTIPTYNHVVFDEADSSFPRKGLTECRVSAGKNSLVIYDLEQHKSYPFPVTRMRCWRITGSFAHGLKLSFHFLRAKDKLMWITLSGRNCIFMSMCLQSIVDELVRQKHGQNVPRPRDRVRIAKPTPQSHPPPPPSEEPAAPEPGSDDAQPEPAPAPAPAAAVPPPAAELPSSQASSRTPSEPSTPTRTTASKKKPVKAKAKAKAKTPSTSSQGSMGISLFGKRKEEPAPEPADTMGGFNMLYDEEVDGNVQVFAGIGDDDL